MLRQRRPIPAERLILEAIDIYQRRGDERGLAQAYRLYGFYLRGYGHDQTKAIQYLERSAAIGIKNGDDDLLADVYLNAGGSYEAVGNGAAACAAYDQSVAAYQRNAAAHPDAEIRHPKGYRSLGELIDARRSAAGCL
jgi:hypothetical protein